MDKLEVSFSQFHGMQWVFPEDKSSIVPGAMQATKCGLSSWCLWIGGHRDVDGSCLVEETLPRALSQHDHLCKGQENLIWKTFIYSFLTPALLWGERMEAISLARHAGCPGTATLPSWKKRVQGNIWNATENPHFLQHFDSCIFHLGQGLKFSPAFKESFGFPLPTCQHSWTKQPQDLWSKFLKFCKCFKPENVSRNRLT